MSIPVTGISHVRLTVTDLARSRACYDALFGWDVAYELPADARVGGEFDRCCGVGALKGT